MSGAKIFIYFVGKANRQPQQLTRMCVCVCGRWLGGHGQLPRPLGKLLISARCIFIINKFVVSEMFIFWQEQKREQEHGEEAEEDVE